MIRKSVLAIVAATSLGVSAVAVATPAQAWDDWHHHHHCHLVVRDVQVWHPFPHIVHREFRVCD